MINAASLFDEYMKDENGNVVVGVQVTFTPIEAEELGCFIEDALTHSDALAANVENYDEFDKAD